MSDTYQTGYTGRSFDGKSKVNTVWEKLKSRAAFHVSFYRWRLLFTVLYHSLNRFTPSMTITLLSITVALCKSYCRARLSRLYRMPFI